MNQSKLVFTGIVVRENTGFSALCVELDVASDGRTIKEAKKNLLEAVSLYVETAIENNLPIVRPVPLDENPLVTASQSVVDKFSVKLDFNIHIYA